VRWGDHWGQSFWVEEFDPSLNACRVQTIVLHPCELIAKRRVAKGSNRLPLSPQHSKCCQRPVFGMEGGCRGRFPKNLK
jgi:hypothetical protein